jgi:Na+-transporting methylmalonyl-CoA/oxaloacetate decarboxylase gamma subunit
LPHLQRQFDESAEAKRQAKTAAEKNHSDQCIRLEQLKAVLAAAIATQVRSAAF